MRALWLVVVLAACMPTAPSTPRPDPIPYRLDESGIQLTDRVQRIDFGRTDHSTLPAMTKLVGAPPFASQDCAGGGQRVDWPDGTSLVFKGGTFRGWINAASAVGEGCS
ncbi:hypothetical protein [uncultured Litoreibacter sp.]|uniref:hypothetical protein n=1 Tax=uncultured Litoreibacter sp. TaxID=1392394 RepID=UPI0026290523|nr:hypothetical protein [uncultured Litoreibacter sp.]